MTHAKVKGKRFKGKAASKKSKLRLCVLASGSGTNLQAIIDACERGRVDAEIAVVISDKLDAYALWRAVKHGIPALFLNPKEKAREEYDGEIEAAVGKYHAELIVLAGYMRVLTPPFVRKFYGRIMNIHPALLPSFPGLHGQKQALDYGVKASGCTVHFVDEGTDTGPIILQHTVPVLEGDDEDKLKERILEHEHKAFPEAIQLFAEGRLKISGRRVSILAKK